MIEDDYVKAIADEFGCTFDGCGSKNIWMTIQGKPGTDVEGKYAFLCEDHVKEMTHPKTDADRLAWVAKVGYVEIVDLGEVSLS